MGIRFRKSINCGLFRINLSKSGIGYSVGVKGYRKTHKVGGGSRTTLSIPGSGISYVKDSGCIKTRKKQNHKSVNEVEEKRGIEVQFNPIPNGNAMIKRLNTICKINSLFKIARIVCVVMVALGIAYAETEKLMIIMSAIGILGILLLIRKLSVRLEYEFDDTSVKDSFLEIQNAVKSLSTVEDLRLIKRIESVDNPKSYAGIKASAHAEELSVGNKKIKYIKNELNLQSFYTKDAVIVVLPDCVALYSNNKWKSLAYSGLKIQFSESLIPKGDNIPSDTLIVEKTFEHVNKDGTMDRRYKENREMAVCRYGALGFGDDNDAQIVIVGSNYLLMHQLFLKLTEYKSKLQG